MDISQVMILFCSCVSIWGMAGKKHKLIGFGAGLIGQPFWIYTTWNSGQWGMFIVSLWFTFNHVRGLRNHWKQDSTPSCFGSNPSPQGQAENDCFGCTLAADCHKRSK